MPFGPRKRFLALVLVAAGLFFLGSLVAQGMAEERIAATARATFELTATPEVELSAFPFLYHVLQGRIPRATVRARDVPAPDGLVVSRLRVVLDGLRFEGNVLGDPSDLTVVVERGRAEAIADERRVNEFLAYKRSGVTVQLREGVVIGRMRRLFLGRVREFVARGTATIRDGRFAFTATRVTMDGEPPSPSIEQRARERASFSVPLPPLPGDIRLGALRVHDGFVTMTADVRDYRLGGAG